MNLDIEIPNRNFHELCNVIKWKEAPHTYNKEELQAKSIADVLYNNMTFDSDDVLKHSYSCAHGKEGTFNYLLSGKSDEELQMMFHKYIIVTPAIYFYLVNIIYFPTGYYEKATICNGSLYYKT